MVNSNTDTLLQIRGDVIQSYPIGMYKGFKARGIKYFLERDRLMHGCVQTTPYRCGTQKGVGLGALGWALEELEERHSVWVEGRHYR